MTDGNRYPREQLAEAAGSCGSIEEVVAFFGTPPYARLHRYLFARFEHFGIDVSHFPRRRRGPGAPRPAPEDLRRAVAASVSVAEALRRLGRPDNMSQRALLRQWLADAAIPTAHFLGQGHQRGRPSPTPRKAAEDILTKREGGRRTKTAHLRRALSEIGVRERCDECGTGPVWQGLPMTLEVDHVNGDWRDDRAENLRLLCPNCHATTSTWCRGGGKRHGEAAPGLPRTP